MNIDLTTSADTFQAHLSGRFDYTTRSQFVEQVVNAVEGNPASALTIDMSSLDYIDSSALGMLLMLRDKARRAGKTVVLSGVQGTIMQIIRTAQFDKLFAVQ